MFLKFMFAVKNVNKIETVHFGLEEYIKQKKWKRDTSQISHWKRKRRTFLRN